MKGSGYGIAASVRRCAGVLARIPVVKVCCGPGGPRTSNGLPFERPAAGGIVSVQVLNEFAHVALRKLGLAYCDRFGYSVYDCMILAAATLAECSVILTEDMQADQHVSDTLTIRNPFASS